MEKFYNMNECFDSPRVKFFFESENQYLSEDLESIENQMNEWLKEHEKKIKVIDIKYTTTYDGEFNGFSACIFYNLI